ncbi:hypothetical protein K438DRAFT_871860 [Mycena galopus ATCC 62051]|nr:hypothetical protein K438DRAFT_871860 [Mycena galopus ATCC 62051]
MDVDEDDEEGARKSELDRAPYALVLLAMFTESKRCPSAETRSQRKLWASTPAPSTASSRWRRTSCAGEARQGRRRAGYAKPGRPRRGAQGHRQEAPPSSKTYILRSILNEHLIEEEALTREELMEEEAADAPADEDEGDEIGSEATAYGSIISWSSADHVGAFGVLYVVLAHILVSGRVMGDHDLRATLKRLRLPAIGIIGFSAASTHRTLSLSGTPCSGSRSTRPS